MFQNNPQTGDSILSWHRKIWKTREGEKEDITKAEIENLLKKLILELDQLS